MKKITIFSGALFLIMAACGPTQNEAVKYNDSIMGIVDGLAVEHNLFLNQVDGHNIDSLKIAHQLFTDKAKTSLEASEKIGPFADKKDFSDVTHDYFVALNSIANDEGKQLVEIMSKDTAQVTQADLDKVNELAAKIDDKYGKVYDKLQAEQQKFSTEWKFTLIDAKK